MVYRALISLHETSTPPFENLIRFEPYHDRGSSLSEAKGARQGCVPEN